MPRPLRDFAPFLISANVRDRFCPDGLLVSPGIGRVGDLVLGSVVPLAGEPVTVFDQELTAHTLDQPTRVVAILGTRRSTTHVNAGIPDGGLEISPDAAAHWIAGESGLVGRLVMEPNPDSPYGAERSVKFRGEGLLTDSEGRVVNIASLAVEPSSATLTTPLLFVAATAAEAGKTTLTGRVIRYLVEEGKRVAAVKGTGTGGTMDSQKHREAGACVAVDQVDAGLITTYGPPDEFRERIFSSFLFAQDHEPDIILGELGGDLTFANNPTLLLMPEIRKNLRGVIVISNDPLSCYGVNLFLTNEVHWPPQKVRHFTSPFRNVAGMKARASAMGVSQILDPNDEGEIQTAVRDLLL